MKGDTVGQFRAQSAYVSADTPIQLVSSDPKVALMLAKLRVVRTYPDTRDAQGNWTSTFKIEVEEKS